MNYAKAFRVLRGAFGLTQAELARLLDIGPSQVSLIESGKRKPSLRTLGDLSRALDVPKPLLELLALESEQFAKQDPETINVLSRSLLRLLIEARSEGRVQRLPLRE